MSETILQPQRTGIPAPRPTPVSEPFWEGCRQGELRFQRCAGCARPVFIPAVMCRYCGHTELLWERSAGTGTVYSWTIVWRPQTPAYTVPYAPAIVHLDEGYEMLTNLVGCRPDEVRSGARVAVEFHALDERIHLPYFRPVGGAPAENRG